MLTFMKRVLFLGKTINCLIIESELETRPGWTNVSHSEDFNGTSGKPPNGIAKPERYKPGTLYSHLCHKFRETCLRGKPI